MPGALYRLGWVIYWAGVTGAGIGMLWGCFLIGADIFGSDKGGVFLTVYGIATGVVPAVASYAIGRAARYVLSNE